jgi:CheY-like chemotaxis protein
MDDQGQPPNAADADDSRRAEEARRAAAIGLALLNAKHDLNNLFHVARGWSRMLKDPRTGSDQTQEGIDAVLSAAEQTSELISGIVALNGPASEGLALCDLARELTSLGRGLRYLLPIPERFKVELGSGAFALCNLSEVRRALLDAVLDLREQLGDDELLLRLSEIADPNAPSGSALELELRRLGRTLDRDAASEPCLQLRFPRHAHTPPTPGVATPSADPSQFTAKRSEPTRILLVDDHRDVRRLATTMLERAGYQVLTASDAQEALVTSESYDGPIHVLCCDAQMPGLPPLQLITQLCAARPDLRVLVCTGARPQGKLAEFPRLPKPFSYQQLVTAIRNCLE